MIEAAAELGFDPVDRMLKGSRLRVGLAVTTNAGPASMSGALRCPGCATGSYTETGARVASGGRGASRSWRIELRAALIQYTHIVLGALRECSFRPHGVCTHANPGSERQSMDPAERNAFEHDVSRTTRESVTVCFSEVRRLDGPAAHHQCRHPSRRLLSIRAGAVAARLPVAARSARHPGAEIPEIHRRHRAL